MTEFFDLYPWTLPFVIFFGRICDVSLGTLRIVFVAKGEKKIAPLVGFVELFIWIVIIAQIFTHASDIYSYLAYAGGYAVGTYCGLCIEERIGFGFIIFRVFTLTKGQELVKLLNEHGFGSTVIHGTGSVSEIDIIEAVVSRKNTKKVERIITDHDPDAFYLIEDVRSKQKGIFSKGQALSVVK